MANKDRFDAKCRSLVDKLADERKRRGLIQVDVAEAMGIDESQLSKLERGERRLDVIDFVRYCRAIGVDPGRWLNAALRQ